MRKTQRLQRTFLESVNKKKMSEGANRLLLWSVLPTTPSRRRPGAIIYTLCAHAQSCCCIALRMWPSLEQVWFIYRKIGDALRVVIQVDFVLYATTPTSVLSFFFKRFSSKLVTVPSLSTSQRPAPPLLLLLTFLSIVCRKLRQPIEALETSNNLVKPPLNHLSYPVMITLCTVFLRQSNCKFFSRPTEPEVSREP